ncbi:MAG: hypothetical protein WB765_22025 [Acidimicrobiales bacterium]
MEAELLAAFSRLAPAGSHRWNFEESMSRLNPQPPPDPSAVLPPWAGLPDDLWARGRSAQVGQRMMGDVVAALADVLAADSRTAISAALGSRAEASSQQFTAAWDALRYLAARVDRLEQGHDVVSALFPDMARRAPHPQIGPWADRLQQWFPAPDTEGPVVHGESGDGSLLRALTAAGYQARGIDPRPERVWAGAGNPDMALGEVSERLGEVGDGELAGLVLSGGIDRLDVPGTLVLAQLAVGKTAPGATVAVLPMDPEAWSDSCPVTVADLAPGRPFHPETWTAVLERTGLVDVVWHRPEGDETTHAVVGRRR